MTEYDELPCGCVGDRECIAHASGREPDEGAYGLANLRRALRYLRSEFGEILLVRDYVNPMGRWWIWPDGRAWWMKSGLELAELGVRLARPRSRARREEEYRRWFAVAEAIEAAPIDHPDPVYRARSTLRSLRS